MMSLVTSRSRAAIIAVFLGALAAFPLFGQEFYTELVTRVMILSIFAISLDLLVGYTGLVSFGHAAWFGMGGYVFDFSEGSKDQKDLLGGKGANLAEMTNLGLPVPPGFTISTEACRAYLAAGDLPDGLADEIEEHLTALETAMGRRLGDPADPLLVSVRSGAAVSMPGMMETVLNVGLGDESVRGLAEQSKDERFAMDSYRRLLQMFGKTVLGVDGELFEHALDEAKSAKGVKNDLDLDADDLRALVDTFKGIVREAIPHQTPSAPKGPRPIWVRTGTTDGLTSDRRCQLAPSTTRV